MTKHVAYYRVSTKRQGESGLGLEAQRAAVIAHLGRAPAKEYTDVESGKNNNRPELLAALRECRLSGAVLVIAKLDRLSRSAGFLLELRDSEVEFICCDMPNANRLTIGIMALMAEHERDMISKRTKAALAAAKVRGTKLGNVKGYQFGERAAAKGRAASVASRRADRDAHDADLAGVVAELRAAGASSVREVARALNERGHLTPRGAKWTAGNTSRLLRRLAA